MDWKICYAFPKVECKNDGHRVPELWKDCIRVAGIKSIFDMELLDSVIDAANLPITVDDDDDDDDDWCKFGHNSGKGHFNLDHLPQSDRVILFAFGRMVCDFDDITDEKKLEEFVETLNDLPDVEIP